MNILRIATDILMFIVSISILVLVIKNRRFLRDLESRITLLENYIYRRFGADFESSLRKDKEGKK